MLKPTSASLRSTAPFYSRRPAGQTPITLLGQFTVSNCILESPAEGLRPVARNHVNQADEIQRVLPVDNQKSRCLVVQVEVLAQETPKVLRVRCRLLRIILIVTKCLDVADNVSFQRQDSFEGRARAESAVTIDCQHALSQPGGHRGCATRAETV